LNGSRQLGDIRREPPRLIYGARGYRATQAGNLRINHSSPTDCHFLIALSLRRGTAMKKLAVAIAAIALIGTSAFAQAPPPAPVPVYNWTGWYVTAAGGMTGSSKQFARHYIQSYMANREL
jgi:hypothetical protein